MPLESFDLHINIQDLSIEFPTPEDALHAKLRSLITSEDWGQVKAKLEYHREQKQWWNFRPLAVAIKWAFADNHSTLDLGLSEDVWNQMALMLETDELRHVSIFATSIMETTVLFPQKIEGFPFKKKLWKGVKKQAARNVQRSQWIQLANILFDIKIITSAKLAEIHIDEDTPLQSLLTKLHASKYEPQFFAHSAAKLKALIPKATSSFQIEEQLWERIWERIKQYRNQRDWDGFGRLAGSIIILIANQVRITDGSLEIKLEQPGIFNQKVTPVPIQRNFP